MSNKNEPAFPCPMIPCDDHGGFTEVRFTGLTIRDYFAAHALQGMLARENHYTTDAAEVSYAYADAMMKARGE